MDIGPIKKTITIEPIEEPMSAPVKEPSPEPIREPSREPVPA